MSSPLPGSTSSQASAQPKAIVELIRFNGDGNLTVPEATVSINGAIARQPAGDRDRNYTVGADCTGTLQFGTVAAPGPAYDLFVGFEGSQIQMIQPVRVTGVSGDGRAGIALNQIRDTSIDSQRG